MLVAFPRVIRPSQAYFHPANRSGPSAAVPKLAKSSLPLVYGANKGARFAFGYPAKPKLAGVVLATSNSNQPWQPPSPTNAIIRQADLDGVWRLHWTNYPLRPQSSSLLETKSFGILPVWPEQLPSIVQSIDTNQGLLCHVIRSVAVKQPVEWVLEATLQLPAAPDDLSYAFSWYQIALDRSPLTQWPGGMAEQQRRIWRVACQAHSPYQVQHVYVDHHLRMEQIAGYLFIWQRLLDSGS